MVNHTSGGLLGFGQLGGNDHDTWRRPRSESSADAESVYMTNMVIDSGYHGMHSRKSSVSWVRAAGDCRLLVIFVSPFYLTCVWLTCISMRRSRAPIQSKSHILALAASRSGASRGGTRAAKTPTILPTSRRSHLI